VIPNRVIAPRSCRKIWWCTVLVLALAIEVPGAGGAPQGAAGIEVANVGPRPGDSAEKLPRDLVVRGVGAGISGGAALAPLSSSTIGLGVSGLYLLGSPSSSSPLINWRRVEDEAESAYS
jgi:hypothetical protein